MGSIGETRPAFPRPRKRRYSAVPAASAGRRPAAIPTPVTFGPGSAPTQAEQPGARERTRPTAFERGARGRRASELAASGRGRDHGRMPIGDIQPRRSTAGQTLDDHPADDGAAENGQARDPGEQRPWLDARFRRTPQTASAVPADSHMAVPIALAARAAISTPRRRERAGRPTGRETVRPVPSHAAAARRSPAAGRRQQEHADVRVRVDGPQSS